MDVGKLLPGETKGDVLLPLLLGVPDFPGYLRLMHLSFVMYLMLRNSFCKNYLV